MDHVWIIQIIFSDIQLPAEHSQAGNGDANNEDNDTDEANGQGKS